MMKNHMTAFEMALYILTVSLLASCVNHLSEGTGETGRTGRVLVSIAGTETAGPPQMSLVPRTLLPETGGVTYVLTFTRSGETEPTVTKTTTGTSLAVELEPGTWTLTVTGYQRYGEPDEKTVTEGSAPVTVSANAVTPVPVTMTTIPGDTPSFIYAIILPDGMILQDGTLRFQSLSGGIAPDPVDLSAGLSGGMVIGAGYYRVTLDIAGSLDGQGKVFGKTAVAHITSGLVTGMNYTLDSGDFINAGIYTVETAAELASAASQIQASPDEEFIVLVSSDFSCGPVAFTDPGFSGKTVTLRSQGSTIRDITLSANGSLFTVGTNLGLVLRNIRLEGKSDNNAPLVKVMGSLVLDDRGSIRNNTNNNINIGPAGSDVSASGGGVFVDGGTFEMKNGGIYNNRVSADAYTNVASYAGTSNARSQGGGVYVESGTFTMRGGSIYWNTATAVSLSEQFGANAYAYGGGVYINNGVFEGYGGSILSNTANATATSRSGNGAVGNEARAYARGGGVYWTAISSQGTGIYSNQVTASATGPSRTNPTSAEGADIYPPLQ
jgi:hypothetical protein